MQTIIDEKAHYEPNGQRYITKARAIFTTA